MNTKWVSCWGNATSITDQKEKAYAKDLTLRYPILMPFSGSALRFRFSNLTGREVITLRATVNESESIKLNGSETITINPGKEVNSDALSIDITKGMTINVSIYLEDYTDMNSGVLITGPLSKGTYTYGNYLTESNLPANLTRNTNWFYFLNTIDILTDENNKALVCYGDSITAQSWPDYLAQKLYSKPDNNIAVIRRAVSGTRILRQYDCITYAAYGLKGEIRFPIEIDVAGASGVIIQHGINDIIHPVGVEVNKFRPMSDLPTAEQMAEGVQKFYVDYAKKQGLKVFAGTLLPIYGWRTYADFREVLKNEYNDWLRTSPIFDGVVDFDKGVRDQADMRKFAEGYDSGDHLHPSESAYEKMAETVLESGVLATI